MLWGIPNSCVLLLARGWHGAHGRISLSGAWLWRMLVDFSSLRCEQTSAAVFRYSGGDDVSFWSYAGS
jgi:hypothetical protein